MEYRRRHKKNSSGSFKGVLRALLVLLIFGASLYLVLGTGAGKKLKEGYAVSLLDSCISSKKNTPSPTMDPFVPYISEYSQNSGSSEAQPTGSTKEVVLHSVDIYMLQYGVYEDEQQCEQAAKDIKSRGAAGYVYNDSGSYRLIAAAYSNEASAQSVISRLSEEGYDCTIFSIKMPDVPLLITASDERIGAIETAFEYSHRIITKLDDLAISFDRDNLSPDSAKMMISELLTNVRNAMSGISDIKRSGRMMELLADYYDDIAVMLEGFSGEATSRNELSSLLKYIRTEASLRYCRLLESIGG